MSLEDKTARGLGVNVNTMRILISLTAVLLAGISTAVAGAISFLGLIVPHIGRFWWKRSQGADPLFHAVRGFYFFAGGYHWQDHRGALEVSASIIMSVVGGPFFIILLRRSKKYAN